jgi:hypothetical protein
MARRKGDLELPTFPLYTSSWRTLNEQHQSGARDYVPVRISLGAPRAWAWAKGAPYISELAPYGLLKKPRLSTKQFEKGYIERLEAKGVEQISRRFAEVYAEYLKPLALLCYEDVHAGEVCHRRMFAEWWKEQTGQSIPELKL